MPFTRGAAMPTLLTGPDCAVTRKGEFATQNLWVTPHADDERWPAGEFTVQGAAGKGLPEYVAADRDISSGDLVLWHSFGVVHVPRPEDFPAGVITKRAKGRMRTCVRTFAFKCVTRDDTLSNAYYNMWLHGWKRRSVSLVSGDARGTHRVFSQAGWILPGQSLDRPAPSRGRGREQVLQSRAEIIV